MMQIGNKSYPVDENGAITIPVGVLAQAVEELPGVVCLVGENTGCKVLIDGEISHSTVFPSSVSIETEIGTVYLDSEGTCQIAEYDCP